jgi:nucleoid DNA-binding protein
MSLNKKTMVREIGRRTRLKNRDVQAVINTLIEVWTEELVSGGRIEIENFFVLTTKERGWCQNERSRSLVIRTSKLLQAQVEAELGEEY